MRKILCLLIAVVIVCGCTAQGNIGSTTSIGDIIKNFSAYENKSVVISGTYMETADGSKAYLMDAQNYEIEIACAEAGRPFNSGEHYQATGVVRLVSEKCDCQERWVVNITQDDWKEMIKETPALYGLTRKDVTLSYNLARFLPSPEEDWNTINYFEKTDTSACVDSVQGKTTVEFHLTAKTGLGLPPPAEITIISAVIAEKRCNPNAAIARDYALQCTEPMTKIS